MSKFESDSSSSELAVPGVAEAPVAAANAMPENVNASSATLAGAEYSSAAGAHEGASISAEDMDAIMTEPTGPVPSADEMEDRDDARRNVRRSADNLLPREKLENGLRQARMILATGWAGFRSSVRELEKTETVEKIKSGTVTMIDRSMDGLSKVGSRVAEVTDSGVRVVGAKVEEAAPTIGRWRDSVVIASERGFASAREMTGKAIAEMRKRPGAAGSKQAGGVWPEDTPAPGSGPTAGGIGSGSGDADPGPRTV